MQTISVSNTDNDDSLQAIQHTHDTPPSEHWQCNLCQMNFSSRENLQIHIQNQHGDGATKNGNDAPAKGALNADFSTVSLRHFDRNIS